MAMWFAHLRFADAARRALGDPALDAASVAWGSLCCDVDKVAPVDRAVSHYGHEGLSFAPEHFLDVSGLDAPRAWAHRAFLAGYLSHLAVDEAWYGALRRLQLGGLTWTLDTVRAVNLALDPAHGPAAPHVDWQGVAGHEVLPHVHPHADTLRWAAATYTAWDGSLHAPTDAPMLSHIINRFQDLARREAGRVAPILERLDVPAFDAGVERFTTDVLGRFLADLERRLA